jgi:hypothetical protein
MNIHQNARLTPQGRALVVHQVLQEGWTVASPAAAVGGSECTAYRWLAHDRTGGASARGDPQFGAGALKESATHRLPDPRAGLVRVPRHPRPRGS